GCPVNETGMMLGNEDGPLREGEMAYPFLDGAVFIDVAFILGLAVGISASIHRIGEDVVDGRVSRSDPADRAGLAGGRVLERQGQAFRAEPEPHTTRGAELGETLEDGADSAGDGRIRMKEDFPILFSPDEPDGQSA